MAIYRAATSAAQAAAVPLSGAHAGSPESRPGNANSIVTEWSVDPDDWGAFLCRTFDVWHRRDIGKVFVNWFENAVKQLMGQPAMMCVTAEICGHAVAIERDGSVYSCDHYVYPEFKLGNLQDQTLSEMVYSGTQRRFGCNKRDTLGHFASGTFYFEEDFLLDPEGKRGHAELVSSLESDVPKNIAATVWVPT